MLLPHRPIRPLAGSASAKAVCVDPKIVKDVWPKVSQFIRQAMQRGDLGRFDRLEADLLAADGLLWLAVTEHEIHAAVITQLIVTECSKVCMIQACGGNGINNWIGLIETIEDYAKNQRCDCVRLMGRRGWARMLKGYRADKVIMERRF